MILTDVTLEVTFSEHLDYRVYDKPDDFYCIDGFPKNSPPCVVIVPPVMR